MRPIRRFGTPNLISDRLASKSHDKLSSLTLNRSSWSSWSDDRARIRNLFYANNYTSSATTSLPPSQKENRRFEELNGVGVATGAGTGAGSGAGTGSVTWSVSGSGSGPGPGPNSNSGSVDGVDNGEKTAEVIMNTPAFQLVCDRRRVQHRHASADDAISVECSQNGKPPKSAMKKSPTDGEMSVHRSRWATFRRSVSFADDKGLKLAEIKLIDMSIPEDYRLDTTYSSSRQLASGFIADFILPPSYRRLRSLQITDSTSPPVASSQIVLESYTSSRWSVTGTIAVRSSQDALGQKRVFVRFTNDQWSTNTDNEAILSPNKINLDQNIERYSFTLPFPLRPQTGSRLEFKFGVRMPAGVGGVLSPITYWDDNHGSNYSFTFV